MAAMTMEAPRVDAASRRAELASFLKARREELKPEDVGVAPGRRRRVVGLRRHEVADLAAVSLTWYTWLEQARDIHVSIDALDSLARALQLDEDEWRHIRLLGGSPVTDPSAPPAEVPGELLELLDDVLPGPAYVTTGPFDILASNRACEPLFGGPALSELPIERQNGLWQFFMGENRNRLRSWESEAEAVVARFRADAARVPGDERFQEVIEDLSRSSDEFRQLWQRLRVRRFAGGVQVFDHPEVGEVRTRLQQLRPVDHPALVVKIHRPADEISRERLQALLQ